MHFHCIRTKFLLDGACFNQKHVTTLKYLPIAPSMTQAFILMSALVISIFTAAVIKVVVTQTMLDADRVRWADVIILADIFAYTIDQFLWIWTFADSIDQLLRVWTGFDRSAGWWLDWMAGWWLDWMAGWWLDWLASWWLDR